jgi:hypothetical protein
MPLPDQGPALVVPVQRKLLDGYGPIGDRFAIGAPNGRYI